MRITGKMMYDGLSSAEKIEFEKWLKAVLGEDLEDHFNNSDEMQKLALSDFICGHLLFSSIEGEEEK